jgi:uncharacterized protein YheU (UPF0270 family)
MPCAVENIGNRVRDFEVSVQLKPYARLDVGRCMARENSDPHEEGIEIPYEQITPETLLNMLREFVSREWAEMGDSGFTLDDKVSQVLRQLETHNAKVLYDLTTESWNIVAARQPLASGNTGSK